MNREQLKIEMLRGQNFTDMILTLDKYYPLETPIGSISKGIIINNLVSKYQDKLNGQKITVINELKPVDNLRGMFAVLDRYVDFVTPFENETAKQNAANSLLNNFESIVTITRLKPRA